MRAKLAVMDGAARSWSIFDGFEAPRPAIAWSGLIELIELGQAAARAQCAELPELLARWHATLEPLGGEPSCSDWRDFRPLRTDREEQWSDWLHHFIRTSTTGGFAHQLLPHNELERPASYAKPTVHREEVIEDRRADLVIEWDNNGRNARCDIEVKVGDRALEKTYDTAWKLQQREPALRWTHYILLPREDESRWRAVEPAHGLTVHMLTWDDVAIALRRELRLGREPLSWRAWAHGFCGLIEQKLLGLPQSPANLQSRAEVDLGSVGDTARRVRQISILKGGLEDA